MAGCLMLKLSITNWKDVIHLIHKEDLYKADDKKYGIETDPHITVLYGFNDDVKADIIKNQLSKYIKDNNINNIDISIKNTSYFNNAEFSVLKFTVESKTLTKLNKYFSELYDVKSSYGEYNPHITIAYLKKDINDYNIVVHNKGTLNINKCVFEYSTSHNKINTFTITN